MNWKLILQLSIFGLAMGLATVSVIPPNAEPACWLVIFLLCGYLIARRCASSRFLHGLLLGVANSVWIVAAHVLFATQYIANHPQEAQMMKSMPSPDSPRLMMVLAGVPIGVISGALIGLFALIESKFVKRAPAVALKADQSMNSTR